MNPDVYFYCDQDSHKLVYNKLMKNKSINISSNNILVNKKYLDLIQIYNSTQLTKINFTPRLFVLDSDRIDVKKVDIEITYLYLVIIF